MQPVITANRVRRVREPEQVDEKDMVTLEEAARLAGRSSAVVANLLDRDRLPWYELPFEKGTGRPRRWTLRSAVMRLPKPKGEGRRLSSRTKAKG